MSATHQLFPPSHEVKPGNHSGLEWMPSWVKTIQQKGFHHQPSNLQNISLKTNHQPSNQPFIINQPTTRCQSDQSTHTLTHLDPHHPGRGEGPSWPIGSPCNNLSRLLGLRKAPTPLSSSQYPGRVPPSPSQWRCLWCFWWWRWGVRVWLEFLKLQSQRCWYGLRYECDMPQARHSCKKCIWSVWGDTAEDNFQQLFLECCHLSIGQAHLCIHKGPPPQKKNETNSCAQQRVLSSWWIQSWSHSLSWWDQKSRTWQMQQTSNLPHLSKLCSVE